MSLELVDIICDFSIEKSQPLMIVASRNQIDYENSYVTSTNILSQKIKSKNAPVFLCRDHCGPYFKDQDRDKTFENTFSNVIKTIEHDIANDFALIHIDVSRIPDNKEKYAAILIDKALQLNPNILFEYGAEDNVGDINNLTTFKLDLLFASNYKNNIKFVVSQTGSLVKETQVGNFDIEYVRQLTELAHSFNFMFKEHNADYLSITELAKRKLAQVDAVNIAPQLGTVQTNTILSICNKHGYMSYWNDFANYVVSMNKWQRWLSSNEKYSKELAVLISGHYYQSHYSYLKMLEKINYQLFFDELKTNTYKIVSNYVENL